MVETRAEKEESEDNDEIALDIALLEITAADDIFDNAENETNADADAIAYAVATEIADSSAFADIEEATLLVARAEIEDKAVLDETFDGTAFEVTVARDETVEMSLQIVIIGLIANVDGETTPV